MIYSQFNSFLFFIMMKVKYLISSAVVFTQRTSYVYKVCFRLFAVLMASRQYVCFVNYTELYGLSAGEIHALHCRVCKVSFSTDISYNTCWAPKSAQRERKFHGITDRFRSHFVMIQTAVMFRLQHARTDI
jgi:hypothetical protein